MQKFEKDFDSYEGYIASKDKWTLVSKKNYAQIFVYKGKQTKTPEGFISRWVLSNFDLNSEIASGVTLRNFDCKQRKFKYVKYQTFDKKYGFGRKIQDLDGDSQWVVAPPGSLFEELVDFVCK